MGSFVFFLAEWRGWKRWWYDIPTGEETKEDTQDPSRQETLKGDTGRCEGRRGKTREDCRASETGNPLLTVTLHWQLEIAILRQTVTIQSFNSTCMILYLNLVWLIDQFSAIYFSDSTCMAVVFEFHLIDWSIYCNLLSSVQLVWQLCLISFDWLICY